MSGTSLAICLFLWLSGIAYGDTLEEAGNLNTRVLELYRNGQYQEAIPLAEKVIGIREKLLGLEHVDTATSLNNLAELYRSLGEYEKALPLLQRAIAIKEKLLGPDDPSIATSLDNLALLYDGMSDPESAVSLAERALKIRRRALDDDHPDLARSLNSLGMVYYSLGRHDESLVHFLEALGISERALGELDPLTATILGNVSFCYNIRGEYSKAIPIAQRSLAIEKQVLGDEHPSVANSLNNLGLLYAATGDYKKAYPLYSRSLEIREELLGSGHPETAICLDSLANLCIDLNEETQSLQFAERAARAEFLIVDRIYSFASERQRLEFHNEQEPYDLFGTLGSASNLIVQVLRYKGLVLDSIVEDQRLAEASNDPSTRSLALRVRTLKSQLNELLLQSQGSFNEQNAKSETTLRRQLETAQSELARAGWTERGLRRAFLVTPEDVQRAMPTGSVLVEYILYTHYLGEDQFEPRYGAVLLPHRGGPVWVPLPGKADDIRALIKSYKGLVRGGETDGRFILSTSPSDEEDNLDVYSLLTELHDKLWAPIQRKIPSKTKTVIISPDGDLNSVSLASLVTPRSTFLAQEYNITYVSTGRDLLSVSQFSDRGTRVLVGDPDFGAELLAGREVSTLSRALDTEEWRQMKFTRLPFTRSECEGLTSFFEQRDLQVTTLLGKDATEARVREIRAPETLHFATHGYFLPKNTTDTGGAGDQANEPRKGVSTRLAIQDPMLRSGLALAGAQTTVDLRANGKNLGTTNDGLLTAAEVGLLDLTGTKLVTLSACDTGSGESRAGEGVLGLRRGFVQAGAHNLLLTLWPVADKETSEMMRDFYARAESQPAPIALAEVQREWLVRLREQRGMRDALRLAGPFVLSFQGRLE